MSKITIQSEIDAKTLLSGVSKLNISNIEDFIKELTAYVKYFQNIHPKGRVNPTQPVSSINNIDSIFKNRLKSSLWKKFIGYS